MATDRLYQDFISFVTDADPGSGGTTLSAPGLSDLLTIPSPFFIALTLDPREVFGAPEIVWITTHTSSATTAIMLRAQEGTSARAHDVGTVVIASLTAVTQAKDAPVAIGTANDEGTSESQAPADHVHEITDARLVAVTGDATVDNGNVTTTTSFVSGVHLAFVMPTGWSTALIVARGSFAVSFTTGSGTAVEARIVIGASNGTNAVYIPGTTGNIPGPGAVHQVVVSGDVDIDLDVRKDGAGDSTFITLTHELSYIAIRAS